jgi:hypothetical protein
MDLVKRQNQLGNLTKQMVFCSFVQMLDTSIMQWQTTLKDQYNYDSILKLAIKAVGHGPFNDHC